jgi:hypothetical protein
MNYEKTKKRRDSSMKLNNLKLVVWVFIYLNLLGCINVFSQDSGSYGILSRNIRLNATKVKGDIRANGVVLLNRNSVDGQIIAGDKIELRSGESTTNMVAPNIESNENQNRSPVLRSNPRDTDTGLSFTNWPSLPLDYYKSIAQSNNHYYTGDIKWTDRDINLIAPSGTISGGVVYISNGYLNLISSKKYPLTACFVAEKGIKINGSCNLVAPTGFPVMVVFGKNSPEKTSGIRIAVSASSIHGLIYSISNRIDVSGIAYIEGQLISGDFVSVGGNVELVYSNCVDSLLTP